MTNISLTYYIYIYIYVCVCVCVCVWTKISCNPTPLRIVDLHSSTLAQIKKFVREGIKRQERALPEDENKEERLIIKE